MEVEQNEQNWPDRRYFSREEKRQICKEYLFSGQTKQEVQEKYGIKKHGGILVWLRKFGLADEKTSSFIRENSPLLMAKKEKRNRDELLKEIAQLKKQLEDVQIQSEGYSRIIEQAEKQFNIRIKKK